MKIFIYQHIDFCPQSQVLRPDILPKTQKTFHFRFH